MPQKDLSSAIYFTCLALREVEDLMENTQWWRTKEGIQTLELRSKLYAVVKVLNEALSLDLAIRAGSNSCTLS